MVSHGSHTPSQTRERKYMNRISPPNSPNDRRTTTTNIPTESESLDQLKQFSFEPSSPRLLLLSHFWRNGKRVLFFCVLFFSPPSPILPCRPDRLRERRIFFLLERQQNQFLFSGCVRPVSDRWRWYWESLERKRNIEKFINIYYIFRCFFRGEKVDVTVNM